jgi:hypothetical protein
LRKWPIYFALLFRELQIGTGPFQTVRITVYIGIYCPWYNLLQRFESMLRSRNYLFRLRLSKSFGSGSRSCFGAANGSDNSFVTTHYHRFHIKKCIFQVFLKNTITYRPNSHARSYWIWISNFMKYFSWPGAGAKTPAPATAPPKSSGSFRHQLYNTGLNAQKMQINYTPWSDWHGDVCSASWASEKCWTTSLHIQPLKMNNVTKNKH